MVIKVSLLVLEIFGLENCKATNIKKNKTNII